MSTTTETETLAIDHRGLLRASIRFYYDLQHFRITSFQRARKKMQKKKGEPKIELHPKDQEYFDSQASKFRELERTALEQIIRHGRTFSVWSWLNDHPGIGPTIAGFLVAEFDPTKAPRPSNFWSFAGLGLRDGHSPHPVKGEKLPYNAWLRAKCLFVLGGSFLKAGEQVGTSIMVDRERKDGTIVTVEKKKALGHPKYRKLYDDYKHRKLTQLGLCMLCEGTGQAKDPETKKLKKCWNCVGASGEITETSENTERVSAKETSTAEERATMGETSNHPERANNGETATETEQVIPRKTPNDPERADDGETPTGKKRANAREPTYTPERAPWGKGPSHRHIAALRFMVKQFLLDFWKEWRTLEGLEVVPSYHEAIQGHRHKE